MPHWKKVWRQVVEMPEKLRARAGKSIRISLLVLAFLLFGISLFNVVGSILQRERQEFMKVNRDNFIIVQTYKEIERLLDAVHGYVFQDSAGGGVSRKEVLLRFELLLSRVPLLIEGEIGHRVSAFPGVKQVAAELGESLEGIEPLLLKLEVGDDSPSYEAIRWELERHRDSLFELSRQFMLNPDVNELIVEQQTRSGIGYWQLASVIFSGALLIGLAAVQLSRDLRTSQAWDRERRRWREDRKELSYQATHDALTGLINRAELERRLQRVFVSAQTRGDEAALLYLDLDRFKAVNDACGHIAGDNLLRQIAILLRTRVRKRDTLARLGGDEFVALLEHCPLPKALRVAEEILDVVRDFRFVWEEKTFTVGASIGVGPVTIGSESPQSILIAADRACYAAKSAGRNCARIYTEDAPSSKWQEDETLWLKRIKKGLSNDRFRLYRQFINPLAGKRGSGEYFEILLRLEDEKGRLVMPKSFFATAERNNLMAALDRWVVRRTVDWLTQDRARLERLSVCFINLSPDSLIDTKFREFTIALLEQSRVPAEKICFEIPEDTAMSNLGAAIEMIQFMIDLGCHFALGCFGAGVATFSHLKLLPVDFIKIDGGLVRNILRDPVDNTLVQAINEVGQSMGKRTIAEHVESRAVLEELRRLKVDFVQGYGVAKPHPLERWQLPVVFGAA